jgi:hypothetical protein
MMSEDVRKAERAVDNARAARDRADDALKEAQHNLWLTVGGEEGMPTEDGWYLDENDNPWRREKGIWDDGWGNSGPEYGYPTPPLRHLQLAVNTLT